MMKFQIHVAIFESKDRNPHANECQKSSLFAIIMLDLIKFRFRG